MSEQQYVKNNDKPSADSVLWEFADDWKTSQQTGQSYASLPGVERVNDELYEGLRDVIKSKNLETIEYQSYFLALTLFPNKDKTQKDPNKVSNWHVFAFETEADAIKKVDQQKKFIKWDFVASTVPKPTTPTTTTNIAQTKPQTTTLLSTDDTVRIPSFFTTGQQQHVLTYIEPVWVSDITKAEEFIQKGYSYIPATLASPNTKVDDVHDDNGDVIGEQHSFLMGRIINVKITDK